MASIAWIPVFFAIFTFYLYWLSSNLPDMQSNEGVDVSALKFPSNLAELGDLARLLTQYKNEHILYVLLLYSSAYMYKQAFAIPGSMLLNLLGGALFGPWVGFPLTCFLTSVGATLCFLMSKLCGREVILKYFPDKLKLTQDKIQENIDSLFFFLLFLRMFPVTPNWFMNMVAPIVNVPVHLFFFSVFLGMMPYNYICVQTGVMLSTLTSLDDVLSVWVLLKLFGIALVALVPALIIQGRRGRFKLE